MRRDKKEAARRKARETKQAHLRSSLAERAATKRNTKKPPPPHVQAIVRAAIARFEARFGRRPTGGEPLFFDAKLSTDSKIVPLTGAVTSDIIDLAVALNAPLHTADVANLVRSGLFVQNQFSGRGRDVDRTS